MLLHLKLEYVVIMLKIANISIPETPIPLASANVGDGETQESRREGWTDARAAVGFCLGSGLFGSYNSD